MTRIEHLGAAGLQAAMDANLAAYWSMYGRPPGAARHEDAEVTWFASGVPEPLFNGVVQVATGRDRVLEVQRELQVELDRLGCPAFWWVSPRSRPQGLAALLAGSGTRAVGALPGMALDLAYLDEAPALPAGLVVAPVRGRGMQELWARVAASGSGFDASGTEALARVEAALEGPDYEAQPRYLGYLHGEPVATSALVPAAGVAGVYAVATLPAARRMGIGRAMTVVPLLAARDAGSRVAVLQASPMGEPVYRAMGFQEVCRYTLLLQA